ncbi:MAG: hypothetical protein ACI4WH_06415 [Oscillospiraceae bacterium]
MFDIFFNNILNKVALWIENIKEVFPLSNYLLKLLIKIYKFPGSLLTNYEEPYHIVSKDSNNLIIVFMKIIGVVLALLPIVVSFILIKKYYSYCLKNVDKDMRSVGVFFKILCGLGTSTFVFIYMYIMSIPTFEIIITIFAIISFIGLIFTNLIIKNNSIVSKILFIIIDLLLGIYYSCFILELGYLIYVIVALIISIVALIINIIHEVITILIFMACLCGLGGGGTDESSSSSINDDDNKDKDTIYYDKNGNKYKLKSSRFLGNDIYEDDDGNEYELEKSLFTGDELIKK